MEGDGGDLFGSPNAMFNPSYMLIKTYSYELTDIVVDFKCVIEVEEIFIPVEKVSYISDINYIPALNMANEAALADGCDKISRNSIRNVFAS